MASIPLPALAIQPQQQQDPLASLQKLMALRSLGNQQQLQQQEIQGEQQTNQLRAMQLQDAQTIQKIAPQYIQKDSAGRITGYDYDGLTNGAIAAGVRPASLAPLQTMRKNQVDTLLAQTQADKNTLDNHEQFNKQAFEKIDGVRQITDPAQRQQAYQQSLQWAQSKGADVSQFPQQAPDNNTLTALEVPLGMKAQAIADAKTQSEAAKNTTDTLLNQNKLDIINAWKQNPSQVLSQVDLIVPPGGQNAALNARTKSQVQFALGTGDVDGAKAAIKAAAEQVGAVEKEAQVAQVTAPIEIAKAVATKRALTTNQSTANVPPDLAASATSDAAKADTDYAQALSVTQRLNAMMDAAKRGNVVSYKLLPQEGALQVTTSQGVHRINMAEIENYGGGSLWQQMQGHFGKALSGKSIPDSVLNDMAEMQKVQADGAQTKYENTLQGINHRYGSSFNPVDMQTAAPATKGAGPPPGATHIVPGKDGKNHYTNATGTVDYGVAP